MPVLLPVVLALLAQTTEAAPAAAASPPARPADECPRQTADSTTIVICTQRPQGYRLNPDVMEAKRQARSGGRPVRQATEGPRPDCATVGPAPCMNAGINLLAAVATAAEMAKRVATGQEIGSMFLTDPHPDEYQLYQMAKARREAEEAEKAAAKLKAKAAQSQPQAPAAQPDPPQPAGN
ncbi:MAG: hypothetical protein ACM3ZV_03675 [Bacillota bacterium]